RWRLVFARHSLVSDAPAGAPVIEVEAHVLQLGRRIELHRNAHQTEVDASAPDCLPHRSSRHETLSRLLSWLRLEVPLRGHVRAREPEFESDVIPRPANEWLRRDDRGVVALVDLGNAVVCDLAPGPV